MNITLFQRIGLFLSVLLFLPCLPTWANPPELILEIPAQGPLEISSQSLNPDTVLPLGQLSEIFLVLLSHQRLSQKKWHLDSAVNDHLEALRLLGPHAGEVTLQHLLNRSSGLAWRQSNWYAPLNQKNQTLKQNLIDDLRPLILPPGEVLTDYSSASLVLAQWLSEAYGQKMNTVIQQELLKPLQMKRTQQRDPQIWGSARNGSPFPALAAYAPDIYGWQSPPSDMALLVQHILRNKQYLGLLKRDRAFQNGASSLGLIEVQIGKESLFYLDSLQYGFSQRLLFWPAQAKALYLVRRQVAPEWLDAQSAQWVKTNQVPLTQQDKGIRVDRDTHSLLKALNLFEPVTVAPQSAVQGAYRVRTLWEQLWFQALLALVWLIWAGLTAWRGMHYLYVYMPDPSMDTEDRPDIEPLKSSLLEESPKTILAGGAAERFALPEPEPLRPEPLATWSAPLMASLASSFSVLFTLGIGPALIWSGRIGDELSLTLHHQPNPWLLACLALPLFALLSSLILLALLSAEWKQRSASERWHYLSFALSMIPWLVWINNWNLLGFRF